jgi:predicted Zn-dependent protease
MTEKTLLENFLRKNKSQSDYLGLRFVREKTTNITVRDEKPETQTASLDRGVMIEVLCNGHIGYAGTCDLSEGGLQRAYELAKSQTQMASYHKVYNFTAQQARPEGRGTYLSPRQRNLADTSIKEKMQLLVEGCKRLKVSDKINSRKASAMVVETEIFYLSSGGSEILQNFDFKHAPSADLPPIAIKSALSILMKSIYLTVKLSVLMPSHFRKRRTARPVVCRC